MTKQKALEIIEELNELISKGLITKETAIRRFKIIVGKYRQSQNLKVLQKENPMTWMNISNIIRN